MATGFPDYGLFVTPGRPDIREGQTRFSLTASASYAAGTTTATVYTVPAGYRLFIGYLKISTDYSCLQGTALKNTGTIICQMYFDTLVVAPVTSDSGFVYEAAETVDADVINNHTTAHTFKINMLGWLVKV